MLKYQRWYDQIIDRARGRKLEIYFETHHIIPRAWGGTDDPDNLVDLTYREHFLVHWLLTRVSAGRDKMVMCYALHCMSFSLAGRVVAAWQFEVAKRTLRREYLIRAKERYERRRALIKEKLAADKVNAERANDTAPTLRFVRDRGKLSSLAEDWLRGHPSKPRFRNKRSQNVNIKAKRIIAEANKVLDLRPDHGLDMFEPDPEKRKRPSKRYRAAFWQPSNLR